MMELTELGYELDGVIADAEHHQFDEVCLATLKRVRNELAQAAGILARLDLIGELTSPEYISRLRGVMGEVWQPIETAPKDCGILIYWRVDPDYWVIMPAQWTDGRWATVDFFTSHPVETLHPTHWRPIPDPPASPVAGEVKG